MADIAQLGIEVTSNGVAKAKSELSGMAAAAKMADSAAVSLASKSKAVAAAANTIAPAMQSAKRATQAFAATNDNVSAMSGSMSGLASQFQDIGVTAVGGMSPLMIALQQGTQIAGQMEMAIQGGGSALGVLGSAVKSLLSPLSILSIVLTAVLAAGIQMTDWASVAGNALLYLSSAIDSSKEEIIVFGSALTLVFSPQIISAVYGLATAVGTGLVGAFIALKAVILANPLFAIGTFLAVSAAAIYSFRDVVAQALGFDIIEIVKNSVNAIIGGFVGAVDAISAVWAQLPSAMGDMAYQGAQAVINVFIGMAREVVSIINGLIASVNGKLREFGASLPLLDSPYKIAPDVDLGNPYEGAANGVSGAAAGAFQDALNVDYVGRGMDAAGRAVDSVTGKLKDLSKAAFASGEELGKAGGKGGAAMTELEKLNQEIQNSLAPTQQLTQVYRSLDQAVNAGVLSTDQANAAWQRALQSFQQTGGSVEQAKAAIMGLSQSTNEFQQGLRGVVENGLNSFSDGIATLITGGKVDFRSMINSMIADLVRLTLRMLIIKPLINALFGGGGGGGFLPFADGGAISGGNVIPFAKGGVVSSPTTFPMSKGRTGLMGEAGPEGILPLRRGPDGKLGVANYGGGGGGGVGQVNNVVSVGPVTVNVPEGTSKEDGAKFGKAARDAVKETIIEVLVDQMRPGGVIATGGAL